MNRSHLAAAAALLLAAVSAQSISAADAEIREWEDQSRSEEHTSELQSLY